MNNYKDIIKDIQRINRYNKIKEKIPGEPIESGDEYKDYFIFISKVIGEYYGPFVGSRDGKVFVIIMVVVKEDYLLADLNIFIVLKLIMIEVSRF